MTKLGDRVKFKMFDSLFKDVIEGVGVLVKNIYGRLWLIAPEYHERLSGGNVMIHEINIMDSVKRQIRNEV